MTMRRTLVGILVLSPLSACGTEAEHPTGVATVTVTRTVVATLATPLPSTATGTVTSTPSSSPSLRAIEGESDGLFLRLISVTRKTSITYTGGTMSNLTPKGKAVTLPAQDGGFYLYVQTSGKNGTKHPIDLTCSYPIEVTVLDSAGAQYTPIEGLGQIAGNPRCNEQTQPGQSFRETFIFWMPKDSKPVQFRWASISPDLDAAPTATIDLQP